MLFRCEKQKQIAVRCVNSNGLLYFDHKQKILIRCVYTNVLLYTANLHYVYTIIKNILICCVHRPKDSVTTPPDTNRGDGERLLVDCAAICKCVSGTGLSDNCTCCHTEIEAADQTF